MNIREGTRRLSLVSGIFGAAVGLFVSYSGLRTIHDQSERHAEFERLTASFTSSHLALEMRQEAERDPSDSSVMPGCCGIEEIVWDKNHAFNDPSGIYSITTESGLTVSAVPAPSAWSYLFKLALPLFGFFVPWGSIRAVGWALAGFSHPMT